MLSEDTKKMIDSLSKEEMLEEIIKGGKSRFQGEKHDYLLTRYALLKDQEKEEYKKRELKLAQEANEIANQANTIAEKANSTSSRALRISVYSVIAALIALIISLLK